MNPTFAEQPGKGEGEGEGLTLELIHRYSVHSPLYSPNLTTAEKIKQLVKISDRRSFEIGLSLANRSRVMGVRPVVASEKWVYMVKLGIGTPPTFTNLDFDTGTSFSWTQCAPCGQHFVQTPPLYWATRSSTYHALPCDHPLCAGLPCIRNQCRYVLTYMDAAKTKGYLVADRFTFASNLGNRSEAVDDVVFGCSKESSPDMYPHGTAVSGIIGMGTHARSFLMQLGGRAKGRFSYCLVPLEHIGHSYLRFGIDIEHIRHAQTTPLLSYHNHSHYLLEVKDLSVNGRLLHLPSDTFKINPDGTGGCLVDTGSWINFMVENALDALIRSLEEHFQRHNLRKAEDPNPTKLRLCYKIPRGFSSYPAIRFHLRGAVLRPKPKNFFYVDEEEGRICLAIKEAQHTIIGAFLQQNHRMVFDVRKHQLTFAEENCARD
ncbi:Aspartic proteinase nepenthesin-2 [Ananas comosus]|nr:Aspartic proteinase nepenthesin-2 [Ananas comosus]